MRVVIGIVIVVVALGIIYWFIQRRREWDRIGADLNMTGNVQILDMSVSNGKAFINFAKRVTSPGKIIGVVTNEKQEQRLKGLIKEAAVADRAKAVLTDVTNLSFADHYFDFVIIAGLQQVKPAITRGRVLQEAVRVLAAHGTLAIIDSGNMQRYEQLLEYYGIKNISVRKINGQKVIVAKRI
ncbi:methyltransferase domain-containing protein [Limosilactobacillus sp. RRLNB_1_1]|uniref:Methyltransferase domain-containing protein n=1 Tax=Limosilactobacillus albertensis TaxID=2759752 RepID=A0A7W3Y7K2_9LACO|nr:methyltransferase domain-containing protein [Limosilactobacillus albertensis]MBB1069070.1 methyltransferase domain-containing protein [Limosilactobacillus albertensis]MCD7118830.1 methyltransferase domain-containing protein [Limosilactobacillus albertensis]MCD7128021.1 methyltransferase domain-containing protein [Limosilactobacillus albertensis]